MTEPTKQNDEMTMKQFWHYILIGEALTIGYYVVHGTAFLIGLLLTFVFKLIAG